SHGIYETYEEAASWAYIVEETTGFAKLEPTAARRIEPFPISTALRDAALFKPDHPMSTSRPFNFEDAKRNRVLVGGLRVWGTSEEARAFKPVSLKREPEKPQKMTAKEKAAMLGVPVAALFYHSKPPDAPLTDREEKVLDHDWAAYQAKSADKPKACKTKEAYLAWRRLCAARDRAKAQDPAARSDDRKHHKRPVTFDALARHITSH
ncbi:hypothetical protein P0D88_50260, partial [Paraburkholderia sp. RL18-103-BIB-C]|uniref:hypothetical protein n=1 Tax=unclassified Paraburkholderia TaxID=2615204 RepID=UPI0038BB01E5